MLSIRETKESKPEVIQWVKTISTNCVYESENHKTHNALTVQKRRSSFHQKGRRIPIQNQERDEKELSKLIDQKLVFKWMNR